MRCGAISSKGKSYGAVRFGKTRWKPHRTAAKDLILKTLRPDRGSVRIIIFESYGAVRCGAVRIFILENPTVRFGSGLLNVKITCCGPVQRNRTAPHRKKKLHREKPLKCRFLSTEIPTLSFVSRSFSPRGVTGEFLRFFRKYLEDYWYCTFKVFRKPYQVYFLSHTLGELVQKMFARGLNRVGLFWRIFSWILRRFFGLESVFFFSDCHFPHEAERPKQNCRPKNCRSSPLFRVKKRPGKREKKKNTKKTKKGEKRQITFGSARPSNRR